MLYYWRSLQGRFDRSSAVRYVVVHSILGLANFALAGWCFYVLEMNHHAATAIGYALHVSIGFFVDRQVTFRAPGTPLLAGTGKYLGVELIMYASIAGTMVITVDWLGVDPAFSRVVLATIVSLLVGYRLNKWWTFTHL